MTYHMCSNFVCLVHFGLNDQTRHVLSIHGAVIIHGCSASSGQVINKFSFMDDVMNYFLRFMKEVI